MAYDKIIDSAKLDGAITSSADAIRAKTGDTAKIAWDESTGFSSAISQIKGKRQTKTVTPKASSQTVKPDTGYDGLSQVTVNGDSDLKASNIAKGVNIFGVTGTLEATKVATGTFQGKAGGSIKTNPVTISGLDFKPTRVVFFTSDNNDNLGILSADTESQKYTTYYEDTVEEEDEDGDIIEVVYYFVHSRPFSNGGLSITLNSDGFTISASTTIVALQWAYSPTYNYIAIG